ITKHNNTQHREGKKNNHRKKNRKYKRGFIEYFILLSPLPLFSPFVVSEKPKVYQGVRVKITVKEMLQQRRALQAESKATQAPRSNSVQVSESVSSYAALCFDPEPLPSTPSYFQPRQLPHYISSEENACHVEQQQQQLLETYLHPELLPDNVFASLQDILQGSPASSSYQPPPLCFNQSLDPGSPTDSSDLSGSFDYSYSPPHQQPLYPVAGHGSSSYLEVKNCGFVASEEYSYQAQYNPSTCYCTACHSPQGFETTRGAEYLPYPSTDCTDYHPSIATDDFLRRELNSFDMCYS
ncbi:colorectal cancer-associated protein 2, partial [Rhinatrema bivittatum]|uniref:colorectal cancer-associated protein 2 n=1 Tax=Rhinatrema bivittatum TaxID=194408 RepID=UPI00112D10B1